MYESYAPRRRRSSSRPRTRVPRSSHRTRSPVPLVPLLLLLLLLQLLQLLLLLGWHGRVPRTKNRQSSALHEVREELSRTGSVGDGGEEVGVRSEVLDGGGVVGED